MLPGERAAIWMSGVHDFGEPACEHSSIYPCSRSCRFSLALLHHGTQSRIPLIAIGMFRFLSHLGWINHRGWFAESEIVAGWHGRVADCARARRLPNQPASLRAPLL